jgi:hypothetical protein
LAREDIDPTLLSEVDSIHFKGFRK